MDSDTLNTSRDSKASTARSVASSYVRQQQRQTPNRSRTPPNGGGGFFSNAIGRVANPVIGAVDVDAIIQRIDVNEVMGRVDWNAVVDEIDWNNLLDKVDIDALIDRVDVNRAMERVDVNAILDRSNLKQIIARSTSGMCSIVINRFRAICIKIDQIVQRTGRCAWCMCCCPSYNMWTIPPQPTVKPFFHNVEYWEDRDLRRTMGCPKKSTLLAQAVQGRNAGTFTRFLAYAIDRGVTIGVALLLILVITHLIKLIPDDSIPAGWLAAVGAAVKASNETFPPIEYVKHNMTEEELKDLVIEELEEEYEEQEEAQEDAVFFGFAFPVIVVNTFAFLVDALSMAAVGRTIGKAIMGLVVVNSIGGKVGHITFWQAVLRAFLTNVLGVLVWFGAFFNLIREDRRSLIDLMCGTTVIYAWDAKAFTLASKELAKENPYGGMDFESIVLGHTDEMDDSDDEELMPLSPGRASAVPQGYELRSITKNRVSTNHRDNEFDA